MTVADSMVKEKKKTNDLKDENQEKLPPKTDETLPERSLDVAEEASASVRELNNVILKLKPIVKQAKSRTIQKVVRQIQKLKKTKGSDEKVEKSRNKAERLLDEIYTIKSLELEQLAQYSLGNTTSFFHLSSQKDVPVEIKAMTRVADNPQVQQYVKAFRAEHKDWEKLGDFMLFKQSGRRYKHATSENRVERIKASEALVKTYIDKKFSGDKDKIKRVESISEHVIIKPRKFGKGASETLKDSDHKKDTKGPKPEKRKLFRSIAARNDSDENDEETSKLKLDNEPKLLNVTKNQSKKSISKSLIESKVSDLSKGQSKKSTILKDPEDSESDQGESSDSDSDESDVDNLVISKKVQAEKVTRDGIASDSADSDNSDSSDESDVIPDMQVTNIIDKNNASESSDSDSDLQSDDSGINTNALSDSLPKKSKKVPKKDVIKKSINGKKKPKIMKPKVKETAKISESVKTNDSDDDFVIKKNNDMVVRKIDWDNFGIGSDFRPSFNKNISEVKKRRQKNDFFENDGDDFDEDDDDNEDEKDVVREDEKEEIKGYGRALIESSFVKSLGGVSRPRPVVDRARQKLEIQVKREMNSKKKQQEKKDGKNRQPQPKPGKYQQNKGQFNKGPTPTENVHPSWAASMKRKQEQGALSAFQGKKIKFDD